MTAAAHIRKPTLAEAEVELSVIGLLLEGAETAWLVLDRIDPEDLLEPLHQRIVEAARRILNAGNEPNALTVTAALSADAGLDKAGGSEYFRQIQNRFGRNKRIALEICEALADQAQRRALLHEIVQTESRLGDNSVSAREVLAEHESAVRALAEGKVQADDPAILYESVTAIIERLDLPKEMRKPLVPYGVGGLDESIGGMSAGDLIIVGARPGMGKSAFGLASADYNAGEGRSVLLVSLEMMSGQLGERWLSMRAYQAGERIPYNLLRLDRVHDHGKDVLAKIVSQIGQMPLIIDQRRGMTVSQISVRARAQAARLRREGRPLSLLIIDHLHLIEPEGNYRGNKTAEVTAISKSLKILAGQLDIPILCLAQLNRSADGREDKRPQLSDLRESGAIEQDADVVLLLHRPEYYVNKSRPDSSSAGVEEMRKWEIALERSKGFINIMAAKVRHGAEDEIKARCEIAYNWIGGRI